MKTHISKLVVAASILLLASCTSGPKSPVNSDPGSGAIKESSDAENGMARDTASKDTSKVDTSYDAH